MSLLDRLNRGPRPLLWDGGLGTALISRGLELGREPPEAWLLSRPEDVRAVHTEFAAAGADVIQTNSFGLLRHLLLGTALGGDSRALVDASFALAAAGAKARKDAMVVASLGPTGLLKNGAGRLQDLAAQVAERFAALGAAGIHLETACDPQELKTLLAGVRQGAPDSPLLVSLTVTLGQSGLETPLGVPLFRMLQEVAAALALPDVVGVNCSLTSKRMKKAVGELRDWPFKKRLPILAQPQVDQPNPDCKRPAKAVTPEDFATDLLALLDEGADAIGGCCGCRAEHLAAARAALDGVF